MAASHAPHINVCIRVRPLSTAEASTEKVVEVIDDQSLVFDPWHLSSKGDQRRRGVPLTHRAKNITYAFDRVFGERATQEEVYHGATDGVVASVLDGYNATVFAYGSTGSGKTHTMMGNERAGPGVMGLAMQDLWGRIDTMRDEFDFEVSVSCLEVYNETLRDLFVQDSPALDMWEDPQGHASVARLSVQHPTSVEEVQRLLTEANSRRRQSPTDANAESSRSHAVFQITVSKKAKAAGVTTDVFVGKLSLIDLAGSERAAKTNNRQERLQEGANINRSLLALANCINALGQGYRAGSYIPFRNSKLTRLLKDSLGGTCRTVMIANVSPSTASYEDTLNTLKYANRTKNIKINVTRKVINVRAHLGQYREMIETLNAQVAQLRAHIKELEAARANCHCAASTPDVIALLDRCKSLAAERASLFRQLVVIEKRIAALLLHAAHKPGSKDADEVAAAAAAADPVLRDSQAQKEKIIGYLSANERGVSRLMAELEQLVPDVKAAVQRDIQALSFDAQLAQSLFHQHRADTAGAILRDISALGVLPADHPIAARLRQFLIADAHAFAAASSTPSPSFAAALTSPSRRTSATQQSPVRAASSRAGLSLSESSSGPRTPLHITRPLPAAAAVVSAQKRGDDLSSAAYSAGSTLQRPTTPLSGTLSAETAESVVTPKRSLTITRPTKMPQATPEPVAPVSKRRCPTGEETADAAVVARVTHQHIGEFRVPLAPVHAAPSVPPPQPTAASSSSVMPAAPTAPAPAPPTPAQQVGFHPPPPESARAVRGILKVKSAGEPSSMEGTLTSTHKVSFVAPSPRAVSAPTPRGFNASMRPSPRQPPSAGITFSAPNFASLSTRVGLSSSMAGTASALAPAAIAPARPAAAFSMAIVTGSSVKPLQQQQQQGSVPHYLLPKQQQQQPQRENETPNVPRVPLLQSKSRWHAGPPSSCTTTAAGTPLPFRP